LPKIEVQSSLSIHTQIGTSLRKLFIILFTIILRLSYETACFNAVISSKQQQPRQGLTTGESVRSYKGEERRTKIEKMNNQEAAKEDKSEVSFIPLRKTPGPMKARYQVNNTTDSLELRCCKIIAANLERYPVEAIGVLDEEGWNAVVRERHSGTAPTKGKGGLDGTNGARNKGTVPTEN
jgi:hypothetical protein